LFWLIANIQMLKAPAMGVLEICLPSKSFHCLEKMYDGNWNDYGYKKEADGDYHIRLKTRPETAPIT